MNGFYRLLNFGIHGDHNGSLVALERHNEIPFDIQRVYYIWGTKFNVIRGKHAHVNLEQIIICVSGSCEFTLDNGLGVRKKVILNSPDKGLYLASMVWREFTNFSEDCVIIVIASLPYFEDDCIRSYTEFVNKAKKLSA